MAREDIMMDQVHEARPSTAPEGTKDDVYDHEREIGQESVDIARIEAVYRYLGNIVKFYMNIFAYNRQETRPPHHPRYEV